MVTNMVVVGAESVDFTDGKGEAVKGLRVHFIPVEPVVGVGFVPSSVFLRGEAAKSIRKVPGVYEAHVALVPSAHGLKAKVSNFLESPSPFTLKVG